ncbi:thioesterase domain-containing protein [Frankia sp. Ag45/Mut15]|uniref:Thioesterase domain-containing protein n=1 Tax=Frankia umida TaxID=573489 RepID=A0ABT0JVS9_9ACTN|nr:thioesterase domain-containing protein [Frankia umida]MCK9875656.1 thioesterase domain-containing protein [Frankia umida]
MPGSSAADQLSVSVPAPAPAGDEAAARGAGVEAVEGAAASAHQIDPAGGAPVGDDPYEVAARLLWARALGRAGNAADPAGALVGILRDELGLVVPERDVRAVSTPAGLADLLAERHGDAERHPRVVSLTGPASGTPLFCFPEAGAPAIALLPLARHFAGQRRVHALQAHGLERRGLPDWSVPAAARRHVADIRLLQPNGPYLLVGHSFGGLIALETARLLRAAGHEVALLALIDTYLPGTARLTRSGAIIPTSQLEGCHPDRPEAVPDHEGRGTLAAGEGPGLGPRVVADRLRQLVELPLAGLVRFRGAHRYEAFHNQGRVLTMTYRPRTYAGPTAVWLADDHDEIEGWRGVLTGPGAIRRIPGDHRLALREPLLGQIVADLRADLAAAESPTRPPATRPAATGSGPSASAPVRPSTVGG